MKTSVLLCALNTSITTIWREKNPTRWRLIAIYTVRFVQICLCRCHSPIHNFSASIFLSFYQLRGVFFFWLVLRFDLVLLECFVVVYICTMHMTIAECALAKFFHRRVYFGAISLIWFNSKLGIVTISIWRSDRNIHRWVAIVFYLQL